MMEYNLGLPCLQPPKKKKKHRVKSWVCTLNSSRLICRGDFFQIKIVVKDSEHSEHLLDDSKTK